MQQNSNISVVTFGQLLLQVKENFCCRLAYDWLTRGGAHMGQLLYKTKQTKLKSFSRNVLPITFMRKRILV